MAPLVRQWHICPCERQCWSPWIWMSVRWSREKKSSSKLRAGLTSFRSPGFAHGSQDTGISRPTMWAFQHFYKPFEALFIVAFPVSFHAFIVAIHDHYRCHPQKPQTIFQVNLIYVGRCTFSHISTGQRLRFFTDQAVHIFQPWSKDKLHWKFATPQIQQRTSFRTVKRAMPPS